MNIYTLLMIIPVVLAVALIIMIVRRNITENSGRSIDIAPAIPAIVVLMIAILVIAPMAESTQDYLFDEKTGELTIKKDISHQSVQPWDSYSEDVTSIVIEDGVSIGSGAFNSLTSVRFISIGEDVTVSADDFGVSLMDAFGQQAQAVPGGQYEGIGEGAVYQCDGSIFTYSNNGATIAGLTTDAAAAKYLVFPSSYNGKTITALAAGAFSANTTIEIARFLPDSELTNFGGNNTFRGCTSLRSLEIPAGVTYLGPEVARNAPIADLVIPNKVTEVRANAFSGNMTERLVIPDSVTTLGGTAFGSTALKELVLGSGLQSVGGSAFNSTAIESVTFSKDFSAGALTESWCPWTFYASDGTTALDKTVASDLAGKTFMGTAAALVQVPEGMLSLTPLQLQQVQLHTQELQQQELDIQPMPFQPSLQTEQEQETA